MPGLFDKLKEGASRAAFEADRMRRISQIQSAIGALKRQVEQRVRELGDKTLELYNAGQLTEPELVAFCDQKIAILQGQIAEKETEVEKIRQEVPPQEPTPGLYGHICPKCKIKLPDGVTFCPRCGSKAEDVTPPPPSPTGLTCPNCGAARVTEAAFCPYCGVKMEAAAPTEATSVPTCPNCHTPLREGTVFCPKCGTRIQMAESETISEEKKGEKENELKPQEVEPPT